MLTKLINIKLEFNKARNDLEASGSIKKDKCILLKLPDLGKLESQATSPLSRSHPSKETSTR